MGSVRSSRQSLAISSQSRDICRAGGRLGNTFAAQRSPAEAITAQFVWFREMRSRNGRTANDAACCSAPARSGGSFFKRSGSFAYTDNVAPPDSTCSTSAFGNHAEYSVKVSGAAFLNRASCIGSSPQMASTRGAPALYALAAMYRTSGAVSREAPPFARGPMMSRRCPRCRLTPTLTVSSA